MELKRNRITAVLPTSNQPLTQPEKNLKGGYATDVFIDKLQCIRARVAFAICRKRLAQKATSSLALLHYRLFSEELITRARLALSPLLLRRSGLRLAAQHDTAESGSSPTMHRFTCRRKHDVQSSRLKCK
ncbi:hypothetical protein SKAU_G00043870 [Synaphobranchus kaupii]|uniref:Uncharacterized protein n=1 Tax=Synaphobranchus kaupii TaxID=118154 RepID=A0A9Q1G1P2_SYNKA|nr:hypothetical protein SKAU_G00043870 [Synaphobranchus kaupii]